MPPRRRFVLTALTTLAIVITAPPQAIAAAAPAPAAPAESTTLAHGGAASGLMLAALRRDLGLTDAEARTQLAVDDRARRVAASLPAALGDTFAGSWLPTGADRLSVAVTDPAQQATIRAAGANPVLVRHSARQLDAVLAQLDRQSRGAAVDGVTGWRVDPTTNSVIVLARDRAAATRFVTASGVDRTIVRIEASTDNPVPYLDIRGGERYWIGPYFCSVGFAVTGGFVTAGHCGSVGESVVHNNGTSMGSFAGSTFGQAGDFAWVATNGSWVPQPWINHHDGSNFTIVGQQSAPLGTTVCRSGSTTGWHCGRVEGLNQTVSYASVGVTVTGLTETTVCAQGGDSGGPFVAGAHAQGVTSGGSGDCVNGGRTYFQPVGEILSAYGLTLNTQPEAPCNTYESVQSGSLARTNASEFEPARGFFDSLSGTHSACLTGGKAFSLELQKFANRTWSTVARSNVLFGDEHLTYTGTGGQYRYRIVAVDGGGTYTLGFDQP
ncbi:S1 family peptidase [Micromonospora sp. NPDC049523]|uniref:S1 family peptidase n=1 Tax=Micromonospora sp. NPDC049523 TaxID=3155921 RepID=UPI003412F62E